MPGADSWIPGPARNTSLAAQTERPDVVQLMSNGDHLRQSTSSRQLPGGYRPG